MISVKISMDYCSEDLSRIENYELALDDKEEVWQIHHKLEAFYSAAELKAMNLYYERPAKELIFVTRKGNTKRCHHCYWPHKALGKNHNSNRSGTRWWTNGTLNTRAFECPGEGWRNGRTWSKNTINSIAAKVSKFRDEYRDTSAFQEYKETLSKRNKGSKFYHKGNKIIRVLAGEEVPKEFLPGLSEEAKQRTSNSQKKRRGTI